MREFTDLTIVLDKSSSMQSIKSGTIKGLNSFLQEQKNVPGDGCWSLILFDSREQGEDWYERKLWCVPQDQVPVFNEDNYVPRGGTALIDAVYMAIEEKGAALAALPDAMRPNRVVFVIMTDGHENSSEKFTKQQLNAKIEHQKQKYNWKFVFLGANQDSFATSRALGISAFSTADYAYTSCGATEAIVKTSGGLREWKKDGLETDLLINPIPPTNINIINNP